MQRFRQAAIVTAVAVATVWGALWLGAPPLIRNQLQTRLTTLLGRTVSIGTVAVRPWALELELGQVAVGAAGATDTTASPQLTVARVRLNASAGSLFRFAPVVEALEVVEPVLHLARTAPGHYDIDDLLAHFAPRPDAPATPPARFALYNLTLRDGAVTFDDRPAGQVHRLTGLQVGVPFVSNLRTLVDVTVEPRLAFTLNGATFDSGGQTTPFAETRTGTLQLGVAKMDLAPYIGYAPKVWPVRLLRGHLDSDLQAAFTQPRDGAATATLRGKFTLSDIALATPDGTERVAWQTLKLGLADVQPFVRRVHLSEVALDGLVLTATRGADGRFEGLPAPAAGASAPAVAARPASAASGAPGPDAPPEWAVRVDSVALTHGRVAWRDAAVAPAAAIDLADLTVKAERLVYPAAGPTPVSLSATLQGPGDRPEAWGRLQVSGEAAADRAALDIAVDGFALEALKPYLAAVVTTGVRGRAAVDAHVQWSAAPDAPQLQLKVKRAVVDDLRVTEGGPRPARGPSVDAFGWQQLTVEDVALDVPARTVTVGPLRVVQPTMSLHRSDEGRWNLERWRAATTPTPSPPVAPPSASAASAATAPDIAPATAPWRVTLKQAAVEGGRLLVADARLAVGGDPLRTEVSAISLNVQDAVFDGDRPVPPASVRLSARTGTGTVQFNGKLGLVPRWVGGTLAVTRLPVHAFAPYAGITQNVSVARAEAGFKGAVSARGLPNGVEASVRGDVLLADVLLQTRVGDSSVAGDDLLQWQALALDGLRVELKPGGKPQVDIGAATLNELRARLVVTEQGRLNLQDAAGTRVGPDGPEAAASSAASAADAASAPASAPPVAVAAASAPDAAASAVASRRAEPLPIDLSIGSTRLTNGRIDFSDNFVRPKYTAELTQLNGRLGAISTRDFKTADLELRGRAAGTADLEISGQVQPLSRPIALDIRARASDLELAPLSPYAAKYVGYAIERGKLTMDLAYRIEPDGRLQATNQVILNQLAFGEKVASPQATTLPVRLAVSLLTDRHGVIDINLPVSGSLEDPEFSVAGMVWKVLGNLIAKAVTAPFSLLSGGGKSDISVLAAVPGTPRLTQSATASIAQVAAALKDRPTLHLTVTGTSDLATEREAYRQQVLDARLVAERRKETLATGGDAQAPAAPLGAADRSRLLKLLYKQADLPDKPRNALGFARDLPDDEMAARLKARIPVDDDTMRELALQRAVAVRDGVVAQGVAAQRVFMSAPKGKTGDGWVPSVKLDLKLD